MSSRRDVTEKPRVTISEIVEQDRIIRLGFEARVGAPLYPPARKRIDLTDKPNANLLYMEERVAKTVNEFARNGLKLKYLNQKQRDEWWDQYNYSVEDFPEEELETEQIEDAKWNAYCFLIGIPPATRIGRMFPMFPDDRHPPKEWPIEVIASVTSGKLLCNDLAEFVEFMMWFAGGWPDTFAGELDKNKAHKLLVQCAAEAIDLQLKEKNIRAIAPKDVKHITPTNSLVTMKLLLMNLPQKITLRPANFTELMKLSGVK